jgi:hypothetical protein
MISRIYRSSHTNSIQTNPCLQSPGNENIEKYFILQMCDYYAKLNNDSDYKNRVELIEEKCTQLKIEYNYFVNEASSMEKTYKKLHPYLLHHGETGTSYLNLRIVEKQNHAEAILRSTKKQMRCFYGFLYHPLIQCIRLITIYHENKSCVKSNKCSFKLANKGKLYILSNILLFIFNNCDINILGYDQFSNWNAANIFAHPIIRVIDDEIDTNVFLNNPFSSNIISPRWIPVIVDKTLHDIQASYYISLIKDIVIIVNILALQKRNYKFQTIFRLDEIGYTLFSFLIGEIKIKELLCLSNKSKNLRKQKFVEMINH